MIQDKTKPISGVITIHDITTAEFITGVINGQFNENDVHHYCEKQPYLMALFKGLLMATSRLIQSKGVDGGYIWNLTERRFDFDNPKDMRLYCDVEFDRLQTAMGIVCDLIDNQSGNAQLIPEQLKTDEAKRYFERAIELGLMDNCFSWKKGLQMLSCFAREMSLKLDLNKATNSDGTKRISWKPFEVLFGIEQGKLRLNYNDIQKTGQDPSESSLIDKVFE